MLNNADTARIYSLSEHLAKKNLLNKMFEISDPKKYAWGNHLVEVFESDGLTFTELSFLDISTFDDNLNFALLNLVDQTISLYDEYQDHFDSDSNRLLVILESLLKDLDQKYQIRLDNTYRKTNDKVSYTDNTDNGRCKPTYAGI